MFVLKNMWIGYKGPSLICFADTNPVQGLSEQKYKTFITYLSNCQILEAIYLEIWDKNVNKLIYEISIEKT